MLDLLLAAGADPSAVGGELEETPLRMAARSVRPDWVRRLIGAGANPAWLSKQGYGPVLDAIYGCTLQHRAVGLEVVRILLEAGADRSAVTSYGESPLRVASNNGHWEAVSVLLEAGADFDQLEWSPLHRATALGTSDEVGELLWSGRDLGARDRWERTPWLIALTTGDVPKCEMLLCAGACLHDRGRCGMTNLMYPVLRDRADCLGWLLAQGADLGAVNDYGETRLMEAAMHGASGCTRVLLEAGSDVRATDHVQSGAVTEASSPEVLRLLVGAGADVDATAGSGYWVLKTAAENGAVEMVRAALGLGASPHVTRTGDTALHAAAGADQLEIARLLLDAGADPNARDVDGWTPLMFARSPECARLLLDAGADVNALPDIGGTALASQTDPEVAEVLIRAGATGRRWRRPKS